MAAQIALRDLRGSRFKFALVIAAIAVGVAALGGTQGCIAAVEDALSRNLREWIAADVTVRSQNPPDGDQIAAIESLARQGVRHTTVIDSIAQVSSDRVPDPQIAAAKVVDPESYPYHGTVALRPAAALRTTLTADSVVVTEDLLGRLKVSAGSSIQLNGVAVRIAAVLVSESDQLAELPVPVPRILVHSAGRAAEALRPRAMYYRTLFVLPPSMSVEPVRASLDRAFPGRRILDYRSPDPQVMWFLDRATLALRALGVVVLLLALLGAAVAMWAHLEPRLDSIAVMKALGGRAPDIVAVLVVEMAFLAGAGCALGAAGGLAVERLAASVVPRVFHVAIATSWNWSAPAGAGLAGFAGALLIPLPVFVRAMRVLPNRVLRRHMPEGQTPGVWIQSLRGRRWPFAFRHGILNLFRPGSQATLVLGSMTAAIMLLLTIYFIEGSLLADLTENLRPGSAALFLAGVLANQVEDVKRTLGAQDGLVEPPVIAPFFPVAILSVDGRAPLVRENQPDWLQRRWLSTRLAGLPSLAQTVEGTWQPRGDRIEVLLPRRLARAIGATVGSRVSFDAGGTVVEARVSALAGLAPLDTFRCCLIFNPALPEQNRAVYYGVAAMRPGTVPSARIALYQVYPSITTWDAGDAARTLETWLDGLLWTVRMAAIFALVTGTAILGLSVAATQHRRIREIAILKSLGATRRRIVSVYLAEFSVVGVVAGAAGTLIAWLTVRLVWNRMAGGAMVFPGGAVFLGTIFASVLLANLGGWVAASACFRRRPLDVLRGE